MKALVLVNRCIPSPMANEICISKILSSRDDISSTYICRVEDKDLLKTISNDPAIGGKVVPFCLKRKRNFAQRGLWGKIACLIEHLLEVLFGPVYDQKMANLFCKTAEAQIEEEMPDVVVSVLQPPAAVEAGYRLKKKYPNLKFLLYDLDTISDSSLGHFEKLLYPLYSQKVLRWEKKVYPAFDLIVHLDSHEQHFHKKQYGPFLPKTLFQGVPLLEIQKEQQSGILREEPQLIYAGRFYPSLREPRCLLDVMALAHKKSDRHFRIDVYTDGEYVQQISRQYSGNDGVYAHNYIPQKEINLKMEEADVLVSLGNNGTNMFPSKIVTYVASMKPIIHVYQAKDDPVIPYLRQYPNVLLLDANADIEKNAEAINDFLSKTHTPMRRDVLEEQYKQNLPSHAAAEILQHLRTEGHA